ncbi:MAG TPA: hypothetical protein VGD01_06785 [Candidatus Elarobacter sp.]|jgi:hypothetical protein
MTIVEIVEFATHYVGWGTFVSAAVAAFALRSKVSQDRQSLRRKQAEVARLVYNDLQQDEYSVAALLMLDYQGWRHRTSDFDKIELYFADVEHALRKETPINRPDKELLVRRSIDSMFGKLEYVAALANEEIALLRWRDFAALFGFYIELMRREPYRDILLRYAKEFDFSMVVEIIEDPKRYPIPIRDISSGGDGQHGSGSTP